MLAFILCCLASLIYLILRNVELEGTVFRLKNEANSLTAYAVHADQQRRSLQVEAQKARDDELRRAYVAKRQKEAEERIFHEDDAKQHRGATRRSRRGERTMIATARVLVPLLQQEKSHRERVRVMVRYARDWQRRALEAERLRNHKAAKACRLRRDSWMRQACEAKYAGAL